MKTERDYELEELKKNIADLKSEIEDIKIVLHQQSFRNSHNSLSSSNRSFKKLGYLTGQYIAGDNNLNQTIVSIFTSMTKLYSPAYNIANTKNFFKPLK